MEFRGLRMLSGEEIGGIGEFLEIGSQERRDDGVGQTRRQVFGHCRCQVARRRLALGPGHR